MRKEEERFLEAVGKGVLVAALTGTTVQILLQNPEAAYVAGLLAGSFTWFIDSLAAAYLPAT